IEAVGFEGLVGRHPEMARLYQLITQIAPTPTTVLITGESGTGKELVARAIHRRSDRQNAPFVAVNVAAIPETLVESELFGHERGAFTGAHARRLGRFELAHGGTVFLDEIGSLRLELQSKLLRVLQEREVERVGGQRPVPVDVRVLAATNANLRAAVRERTFREDLFYRLNVVPLRLPSLRERREDIPHLVEHFVRKAARDCRRDVRGVSAGALEVLARYDWPGNVRELENVIHRAVVLATGPERLALALLVLRPLGILRWLQRRRGHQRRRDRRRRLVDLLGLVVPVGSAALVGLDVRRASAIGIDDGDRLLDLVPGDPIGAAPGRRPDGQLKPGRRRLALVARDR